MEPIETIGIFQKPYHKLQFGFNQNSINEHILRKIRNHYTPLYLTLMQFYYAYSQLQYDY